MGRKSSINSRNKVIGVRVTNDGFEQFKSLTPELRDKFNKLLRQTADGLLNKFIKIVVNENNSSSEIVVNKNTEINVNKNNSNKIVVNKNNDQEIVVNKNNNTEIVVNNNSHEMTEEEFDTFCAELDMDQDDRKINTADALKTHRSKLNKSTTNDSLHSRYMKDLEDKELMKVVLEDI